MATLNDQYLDAQIRHQIFILRVSGRTKNEIFEILNRTERRMARVIRERKSYTTETAIILFAILAEIRNKAWDKAEEVWITNYIELALQEPRFQQAALLAASPTAFIKSLPTQAQLRTLFRSVTFEGKTLRQWMAQARKSDLEKIRTELVIGASQRQNPADVARRVVGSSRARGTDGATQRTRNSLATILATAAIATTDGARQLFYELNSANFTGKEIWVSVLDHRTTPICRSLDGKIFLIGVGPHPPIHFRCRSLRLAALLGGGVFDRPTYQEFLARQPKVFQDQVLGPTRGKLFRQGGLDLDSFVDRRGWDNIPLSELAKQEKDSFIAAGLDPFAYN